MIRCFVDMEILILDTDELVWIERGKAHPEPVVRHHHDEAARSLIINAVNLIDDHLLAFGIKLTFARLVHEVKENERGSIRHRRLLRIQFNESVIDAMCVKRTHEMLNREYTQAILFHRSSPQRRSDVLCLGVDQRLAGRSVRTKTMPVSAGAGLSTAWTSRPECSPMPV